MSTSERGLVGGLPSGAPDELAARPEIAGAPSVPHGGATNAGLGDAGLPDVGVLTQMANEFFRALPGAGPQQSVSAALAGGNLDARPPQYGASLPGISSVPSRAGFPGATEAGVAAFLPESLADGVQGISLPAPSVAPATISATSPAAVASEASSANRYVEAGSSSPFGLPLPFFEASLPLFGVAVPSIPPMAGLPSESEARQALEFASPFYFLQDAGALGGGLPVAGSPGGRSAAAPTVSSGLDAGFLPDLQLPRGQFEVGSVRKDFPILRETVNGRPLIWLDNAATTQKPQAVIDRISYFYEHENSNIHRAAHELAARATDAYEDAREKVRHFLNAGTTKEIVFVRGATEAINLVAQGWGRRHIQAGDEIVVSQIEHHANIVPWQMLCAEKGARLRVIPVDDDGQILLDEYEKLLGPKTKLVSVTQVSNALGTVTPAAKMVQMAHRYGAKALVDGAQAVSHMRVDVQSLDCDFYVFSGHKVFGPTGIGVLFGKSDALADTPPWQGGGNMIVDVTFEKTVYQPPPARFEAGTGNIADAVGLGAAIDYLDHIGMENIERHEHDLLLYATKHLLTIPGLRLIGTAKEKAGVLSFVLDGFKTEEVGAALNREGIAVRSGHHCAQPTLRRFGLETTVRPSLALYNNCEDIDAMIAALRRLKSVGA